MTVNKAIARALVAAEHAHRKAHQGTGNTDSNWATWYAHFLLTETQFQSETPRDWEQGELAQALLDLYAAYEHTSQRHHWSHYFAQRLSA